MTENQKHFAIEPAPSRPVLAALRPGQGEMGLNFIFNLLVSNHGSTGTSRGGGQFLRSNSHSNVEKIKIHNPRCQVWLKTSGGGGEWCAEEYRGGNEYLGG